VGLAPDPRATAGLSTWDPSPAKGDRVRERAYLLRWSRAGAVSIPLPGEYTPSSLHRLSYIVTSALLVSIRESLHAHTTTSIAKHPGQRLAAPGRHPWIQVCSQLWLQGPTSAPLAQRGVLAPQAPRPSQQLLGGRHPPNKDSSGCQAGPAARWQASSRAAADCGDTWSGARALDGRATRAAAGVPTDGLALERVSDRGRAAGRPQEAGRPCHPRQAQARPPQQRKGRSQQAGWRGRGYAWPSAASVRVPSAWGASMRPRMKAGDYSSAVEPACPYKQDCQVRSCDRPFPQPQTSTEVSAQARSRGHGRLGPRH